MDSQPETAGKVGHTPGPGGWLVKDFADGWYWTGDRLNADMAANGGASVFRIETGEYETAAPAARAEEGQDELTERLTKVAFATEFLDVREDILALIERDRRRWLDNIAVCELLAEARANNLANHPSGAPDRPRR